MANLPALPTLEQVKQWLTLVFPATFPDRSVLVGDMAARAIFVALYGGFIEGSERYFRPSTIIRFSHAQEALTSNEQRTNWLSVSQSPGYRPSDQWYADNTREPLRDDLIRNKAIPIGIVVKREGFAPTSPAPIYALAAAFADLFDPALSDEQRTEAINKWQAANLDPLALKRMRLLASGVKGRLGQVSVTLPTTDKVLRLAPGEASIITRDVCMELLPKLLKKPVVVHISMSDKKTAPELAEEAEAIGLKLSTSAELPDVVAVDLDGPMVLVFVEVVHSDGPITELRRSALLRIAKDAGVPVENVKVVTAFEDREASAFRKRVSEIAHGSLVWFRSEPELLLELRTLS